MFWVFPPKMPLLEVDDMLTQFASCASLGSAPRRVSRHTGAYSESALWIPLFQFLQLLITLVKHTGSTSFYDCPDLLTGWDVVTSRLHLLQHLARSQVRDIPDWCSSGAFYFKFLLEPYIICWRVDIEVRVATQSWVWCDFPSAAAGGGKKHGRHPREGFDHAIQSVSTLQLPNMQLRRTYCCARYVDFALYSWEACTQRLSSWKHVGCLFYSTFYRIRKHDLHRAYKCAQCEGFARYSWQACTPRLFSQQACWWSNYKYFNNTYSYGLLLCAMWGFCSVQLKKLEPRDYSFWQHVVSHLYFHRLALSDYWRDFGTSFCMWFYQASGLTVMLATILMLYMSCFGLLVSVDKPRQVLPSASVGSVVSAWQPEKPRCFIWWVARTLWTQKGVCVKKSGKFAWLGSHPSLATRKEATVEVVHNCSSKACFIVCAIWAQISTAKAAAKGCNFRTVMS